MVTEQRSVKQFLPLAAFVLVTGGSIGSAFADEPAPPTAAPVATGQTSPEVAPVAAAPVAAAPALAQPALQPATPAPAGPTPRVHHAAVYAAQPAESLTIRATFDYPQLMRRAVVVVVSSLGAEQTVVFQRSDRDEYVAVIPADVVKAPGISYAIEIEHMNGSRIAAFASRAAPHPITVIEDRTDARERAALARLGGRRSVITLGGEYVGFGKIFGTEEIPCGSGQTQCTPGQPYLPEVDENYYRIEANYTYRSLRTVSEFGFRLGVLRGRSFKASINEYREDDYEVGLNFGAARVRFRILDAWQLEGELVTSITEEGFSAGIGGSTYIGDPYGTKLILGFESLGFSGVRFGTRFYSRMDIVGGSRLVISPIIEVTDMPNADDFGVRLLGEVAIKVSGGFSVQIRGGYQARNFTSGGPGFGGNLSYAF